MQMDGDLCGCEIIPLERDISESVGIFCTSLVIILILKRKLRPNGEVSYKAPTAGNLVLRHWHGPPPYFSITPSNQSGLVRFQPRFRSVMAARAAFHPREPITPPPEEEHTHAFPNAWRYHVHLYKQQYASINTMGPRSRHTTQEGDAFCLLEMNVLWCEKCKSIPEQQQRSLWRCWRKQVQKYLYPQ